jgi:hypothetical protein
MVSTRRFVARAYEVAFLELGVDVDDRVFDIFRRGSPGFEGL